MRLIHTHFIAWWVRPTTHKNVKIPRYLNLCLCSPFLSKLTIKINCLNVTLFYKEVKCVLTPKLLRFAPVKVLSKINLTSTGGSKCAKKQTFPTVGIIISPFHQNYDPTNVVNFVIQIHSKLNGNDLFDVEIKPEEGDLRILNINKPRALGLTMSVPISTFDNNLDLWQRETSEDFELIFKYTGDRWKFSDSDDLKDFEDQLRLMHEKL